MVGTQEYWNGRYGSGGGAGSGSYGRLAEYKAEVVNSFARDHDIGSAVDLGCGDGHQAGLLMFGKYTGLDISEAGANKCRTAFADDPSRRIELYMPDAPFTAKAELALSLDVAYLMPEDDLFTKHMGHLFDAAERHVVVYSTNMDSGDVNSPQVRHRRFTDWAASERPEWSLAGFLPNRFPARQGGDGDRSLCDFYFFSRGEKLKPRYALLVPGDLGSPAPVADDAECTECMTLAKACMEKGQADEALGHMERIIAYQAGKGGVEPRTYFNYGAVLTVAGRLEDAERAYRSALCLEPANRDARAKIARIHLSRRNWEGLKDHPDELVGILEGGGRPAELVPEIARNMPWLLGNAKFKAMAAKRAAQAAGGEDMAAMALRPVTPSEWENRHSPSSVLPHFAKGMAAPDFRSKFKGLLKNLDADDKSKICRIVNNLQKLTSKGCDPASVFTQEEAKEINAVKDYIKDRTVKLAEDLYCFDGYFLPISHFGPDIFANRLGMRLLRNPEKLRGRDIIDVGGYCGDSAVILAEATDRTVHVFEPVPPHQELVKRTLKLNGVENCVLVPLALGERAMESVIYFFGSGSSLSKFDKETEKRLTQIKVQVVPLDDYVSEHGIDVGFIKVDIEGYEQPFLQGAEKTIRSQRPAMSISIYHNFDDFFGIKTLIEDWDLGYSFRIAKTADGNAVCETALVCEAL